MDQVIIGVDPHKLSVTIEARDSQEILRGRRRSQRPVDLGTGL